MDRRKKLPLRLGLSSAVPSVKVTLPPKRDRSRSLCVDRLPPLIARSPPAVARAVTLGRRCSASGTADRLTVHSCYGHGQGGGSTAARWNAGVFNYRSAAAGCSSLLVSVECERAGSILTWYLESGGKTERRTSGCSWFIFSPAPGLPRRCQFTCRITPTLTHSEYHTRANSYPPLGFHFRVHHRYIIFINERTCYLRLCVILKHRRHFSELREMAQRAETGEEFRLLSSSALLVCFFTDAKLTPKPVKGFEELDRRMNSGNKSMINPEREKDKFYLQQHL
ncbi:unnamed protein product, partial [Ixodes persulcatus]